MSTLTRSSVHAWSRRPANLVRATGVILAASVALAWVLWVIGPGRGERRPRFSDAEEAVDLVRFAPRMLLGETGWEAPPQVGKDGPESSEEPDVGKSAVEPGGVLVRAWVEQQVLHRLAEAELEDELGELLAWYAAGRYGPAESRAAQRLELEQAGGAGRPFAWELAGDLALLDKEAARAERNYLRELEIRPSRHAAGWVLYRALAQAKEGKREALRAARNHPGLWRAADPVLRLTAAAELRDWGAMAWATVGADFTGKRPVLVLTALATAAVWLVIVGQFAGFGRGQWWLYGASLGLGVLSATATIFVSVVQEEILRVALESEDLAGGLIHYVAGVGLREESLKLLFFVPLLPWLLRRKAVDAVVAAGLVGLGFAFNENLGYFHREGGFVAVGRLLTSNILHVALTGSIGFALYRTLWFRGRGWEEALGTFLLMVLAHGLYDAFIALPLLDGELSLVSSILLALMSWRYFELLETHFSPSGIRLSVLAVFVLGTALVVGLTLNVVVFGHPPFPAAVLFLASSAQLLPMAFVFIHRFRGC